jgi:hypothetical protein
MRRCIFGAIESFNMDQFPLVYRCAIVVTVKQPFLDWLTRTAPSHGGTLAELQQDPHLYLVPDFGEVADIDKAVAKFIKQQYAKIFVNELAAWWLDEEVYPTVDFVTFGQWFVVAMHTMIFDMVEGEVEKE